MPCNNARAKRVRKFWNGRLSDFLKTLERPTSWKIGSEATRFWKLCWVLISVGSWNLLDFLEVGRPTRKTWKLADSSSAFPRYLGVGGTVGVTNTGPSIRGHSSTSDSVTRSHDNDTPSS